MKKIILSLLILAAILSAPVAKADTSTLTPDMIVQAQFDPEFKAALINYLTTVIQLLQKQLEIMIAQEKITNQIAQNTAPVATQPAPAGVSVQPTMEPFNFEPIFYNTISSLAVVIKEKFDKCVLIIKDENGRVVRQQDYWMTDKDGNSRQLYDVATPGQHTYSITCSKAGFETTTKEGNFPPPAAQE